MQTKNRFKVARCDEPYTLSIWWPTHGSVVKASHTETGKMGSIPAGCWNSLQPLSHFWALSPSDSSLLHCCTRYISSVAISRWQPEGFNSYHEHLTSTVLEHLESGQGFRLGHIQGAWRMGVIIAIGAKATERARPLFSLNCRKYLKNSCQSWGFSNPHPQTNDNFFSLYQNSLFLYINLGFRLRV